MPEVFVHSSKLQDVELRTLDDDATVADLAEAVETGASVWLEDAEEPLEPSQRLDEAGVGNRSNVHVGTCKKVTASVRFNNETLEFQMPPSATLQSLYARATAARPGGFSLDELARSEHTLQILGTSIQPDLSRPVGAFASNECTVAFDLVLQQRFQGGQ